MCNLYMDNKELEERILKYNYIGGSIGATGVWCYSQVEKKLVEDPDDREFFENNQSQYTRGVEQVGKEDRWTFDGHPAQNWVLKFDRTPTYIYGKEIVYNKDGYRKVVEKS